MIKHEDNSPLLIFPMEDIDGATLSVTKNTLIKPMVVKADNSSSEIQSLPLAGSLLYVRPEKKIIPSVEDQNDIEVRLDPLTLDGSVGITSSELLWSCGFYGTKSAELVGCCLSTFDIAYLCTNPTSSLGYTIRILLNGVIQERPFDLFRERNGPNWEMQYFVYSIFRKEGRIVKSGLNYGTHFIVYASNPEIEHAAIALQVVEAENPGYSRWRELLALNRVVSGAKKKLVLALVDRNCTTAKFILLNRWDPAAERQAVSKRPELDNP